MKLDCAIIASTHRADLIAQEVLPSALRQGLFHRIWVVGDYHPGPGYTYLPVPPRYRTTSDALEKRDVALAHSDADAILYLSDDHRLLNVWDTEWPAWQDAQWDILVPARFTIRDGRLVEINNGMDPRDPYGPYAGGHAAIYRRRTLLQHPWSETPRHPNWDLIHSRLVLHAGGVVAHCKDLAVMDIDPNPAEKPRHFTLEAVG